MKARKYYTSGVSQLNSYSRYKNSLLSAHGIRRGLITRDLEEQEEQYFNEGLDERARQEAISFSNDF